MACRTHRLSQADAANLACALTRALHATAPNQHAADALVLAAAQHDDDDQLFAELIAQAMLRDSDDRNLLKRLAEYCKQRGFDIC